MCNGGIPCILNSSAHTLSYFEKINKSSTSIFIGKVFPDTGANKYQNVNGRQKSKIMQKKNRSSRILTQGVISLNQFLGTSMYTREYRPRV